jgi:hypothetical protein
LIRLPPSRPAKIILMALAICGLAFIAGVAGDLAPAAARDSGPTAVVELPEAPQQNDAQGQPAGQRGAS